MTGLALRLRPDLSPLARGGRKYRRIFAKRRRIGAFCDGAGLGV